MTAATFEQLPLELFGPPPAVDPRRFDNDVLAVAVRAALSPELLKPEYADATAPFAGHCYVASEAYYHLAGGRAAGWSPVTIHHEGTTHWWLVDAAGGVVDLTAEQFTTPVPYTAGRRGTFLTTTPSKRAEVVIARVVERHPEFALPVEPEPEPEQPDGTPRATLFDLDVPVWTGDRDDVRLVNADTAASWYSRFHYSGTAGTGNGWHYGVFRGDLMAIVSVGQPGNVSGVAARLGLEPWPGNLEVTRVAVHPASPRNTASRVLRRVLKRAAADRHVEWLFSYSDTGQNHHGGIYQAIGAVYVGLTMEGGRTGFRYNGVLIHPRSVVSRWGSQAIDFVRTIPGMEVVEGLITAKHTYILPVGPNEPAIRAHLAAYAKPYPKRSTT